MHSLTTIVFVDAKPSEQITQTADTYLCFVGLCPSVSNGVPKLKSYKDTKSDKKTAEAGRIVTAIDQEAVRFTAIGIIGTMSGHFYRTAIDSLDEATQELGICWSEGPMAAEPSMSWNGHKFNFKLASGLAVYSNVLALIGMLFSLQAHKVGNIQHIIFALDNLPIDPAGGMAFINHMGEATPSIRKMWETNLQYDLTYECANLNTFKDVDGKTKPAKLNPHAILVDWLAASWVAGVNPDQMLKEGALTESELTAIAAIAKMAESKGWAGLINVDDPDTIAKVLKHAQSKGEAP